MKTMAALAAIIALGLGLRVAEAWDGRPPVYDAQAYAAIAANLEAGKGYTAGEGATQGGFEVYGLAVQLRQGEQHDPLQPLQRRVHVERGEGFVVLVLAVHLLR